MEWDFLDYMMLRLGFDVKWIKWIKTCLNSATVSILINGCSTKEFRPSRGLRQDNHPLAPFWFLIVAKGLAGLVREILELGS